MSTPRYKVEYIPRSAPSQWGVQRHRRGCFVWLGSRGFSLWWRDVL